MQSYTFNTFILLGSFRFLNYNVTRNSETLANKFEPMLVVLSSSIGYYKKTCINAFEIIIIFFFVRYCVFDYFQRLRSVA